MPAPTSKRGAAMARVRRAAPSHQDGPPARGRAGGRLQPEAAVPTTSATAARLHPTTPTAMAENARPGLTRPSHSRSLRTLSASGDGASRRRRGVSPTNAGCDASAAWFRVSRAVGRCVGAVQRVLQAGVEQRVVEVDDAGFAAGRLLTAMMGSMHLSRSGVSLREAAHGAITAVDLDPEQVRDACVHDALAVVGVRTGVGS